MDYNKEINRIVDFIKEIIDNSKAKGIVIGLSGGIDSATTAALCTKAIGKDKMLALIMPCHSLEEDINDAKLVAEHLNIKYIIVNLDKTFDTFISALSPDRVPNKMAQANLKPRLRMCSLYYYANELNYLVAGTGNKSEDDIGYFTKYGDGGVDFLPIQHLYKNEVRKIAKLLGIPDKIINRKPSAGLWKGQTDEDELSSQLGFQVTYDKLDEMLQNIHNNNYDPNDPNYQSLLNLMKKNKHKIQLPPALKRSA
ncbi:MAG: NAD+ synthase [Candidatus Helarchaeota archaeon]